METIEEVSITESRLYLRSSECIWHDGRMDFVSRDGKAGWVDLEFAVTADGVQYQSPRRMWRLMPSLPDRIVALAVDDNSPLEESIHITADKDHDILLVHRRYRNRGHRPLKLSGVVDGEGRLLCRGGRAYHIENLKQMYSKLLDDKSLFDGRVAYGTVCCGEHYWRNLGSKVWYGRSEDQPYPAIFLSTANGSYGLLDAQATQSRWYREVCIEQDGESYSWRAEMNPRGVRAVTLKPGQAIDGETALLKIQSGADLSGAFAGYNNHLMQKYSFRAPESPLRHEQVWGSWNFGISSNCNEDLVTSAARIVKEHFPSVKWIQIDEGWAAVPWGSIGCPLYEGDDRVKFPSGMAAVSKYIRSLGLKPAIWCGMVASPETRLVKEHPEWLLRRDDGSLHVADRYMLDYSREDVREFVTATYKKLICDWGYDGIKLDFWTDGFENREMLYQNDEYTSLELRDWWLKTLRGLIPEDGYLQICCNISSMSPFVVRYADNVRCGVDIGKGNNWQSQIDNSSWLSAESLFAPGRMWLANTDAIGSMKLMDTAMRRSWLTFCGMTGSAVELGGDLRKESPEDWQDAQRILAGQQIGCAFHPLDFGSSCDPIPATLWWSEGGIAPASGERPVGMLAAFNWTGQGISRSSVPLSMLGLSGGTYRAVNFWTDEEHTVCGEVEIPDVPEKGVWAVQLYPAG